ncbi:hypothetical protein CDAR_237891 [Caerostris darwini]|uniref:Uncharacterized protein n=1 Tax=Caerostris darwini TaxID=1538125 RepID=A0AAV4S5F7_9ARAC|nr:hypothetical protein CDAR_237891 [Caerostris darwini]
MIQNGTSLYFTQILSLGNSFTQKYSLFSLLRFQPQFTVQCDSRFTPKISACTSRVFSTADGFNLALRRGESPHFPRDEKMLSYARGNKNIQVYCGGRVSCSPHGGSGALLATRERAEEILWSWLFSHIFLDFFFCSL